MVNNKVMKNRAPIALFAYKRLDYLRQTVEALKANGLAQESDLFIFSDGPKKDEDSAEVQKVRDYLDGVDGFHSISKVYRECNLGLAKNIEDGITRLVEAYGRVIAIEDDIVTSPSFLDYMNAALDRYKDDDQVMAISGYGRTFVKKNLPETYFMPWFDCWGWGTWKRAWDHYECDPHKLIRQTNRKTIRRINVNGADSGMWKQVVDNANGTLHTWAIFFYVAICKRNGLVLYSRDGYCRSIGIEGRGEHSAHADLQGLYGVEELSTNRVPEFPPELTFSEPAIKRQEQFCRTNYGMGGAIRRIIIRMKNNGLLNTIKHYLRKP